MSTSLTEPRSSKPSAAAGQNLADRESDGGPTFRIASIAVLAIAAALLWGPVLKFLWESWRTDESLSHGPLLLAVSIGLLWMRRKEMGRWDADATPGLLLLTTMTLLHIASWWADIAALRPLSLIGMTLGAVWYLGGRAALKAVVGPVGLLAFAIPWPTTLVDRIAFPLQLTSSAYAALLAGLLGLPIHREGVTLAVMPNPHAAPIYSVMVARGCSGLTSMMVLLSLGYLIADHTPVRASLKALMVASVLPLALLANAVRITFVLLAGAHQSAQLAQWIHDHEAPVLVFFCTLGLLGVRSGVMALSLLWEKGPPSLAVSPPLDPVRRAERGAMEARGGDDPEVLL